MRRLSVIIIAIYLFLAIGLNSLSFAQGMNEKMGDQPMMGKDMMTKEKMMEKCPMHGMMMKGMMEKTIIATADGGVFVLVGNKLIKYDKNLNLVKEIEIKIDMEAMQKNMMEMMKNCPMMKDKMIGAGMSGTEEKSEQKK